MIDHIFMVLYLLTLAVTLIAIFWAADRMLLNAVATANHLRIPPSMIGALVIGFGTSAPELVISSSAALQGSLEIAIGNALGSNIANIALVLGTVAIFSGIVAARANIHSKCLIVLAAAVLPGILLLDQHDLSRGDGIVLLASFALAIYLLIKTESGSASDDVSTRDMSKAAAKQKHTEIQLLLYIILLIAFSWLAVWAAGNIAEALNISELIIGLTVIAIGTSLPELAAALIGAYRKQHAIALGSILGSNLFNSLAVTGLPALIHPAQVPAVVLSRDYLVVVGLTAMLWLLLLLPPRHSLGLPKGLLLLACFVFYQAVLYRQAIN